MQPLWRCPQCAREFANRNQTHTCGELHTLEHHFDGTDPIVRRLFKVETFSKRNHVHYFRLSAMDDISPAFVEFLKRAYAVGCQEHLRIG